MKHITKSPDETYELALNYASKLGSGEVLGLVGELGAGKTRFVQGLAKGLGVPEKVYVRSPSFSLINEYHGGSITLVHMDFYRLDDSSSLEDLGLDEYFDGDYIVAVEWPDRFPGSLPDKAKVINFFTVDENTREIEFNKS
jgi:tRNA threonylcarbamoyladenosine biosynthesis protein TsaE